VVEDVRPVRVIECEVTRLVDDDALP
jgi:hypothetical protein